MMRYCSLFSGSGGNCTYVATADGGVLVDAGVSAKRIREALEQRKIDPCTIRAVLVTHDHSDHVSGLRVLSKQLRLPVIASTATMDALVQAGQVASDQRLYVFAQDKPLTVAGMKITSFSTPHDACDSRGFRFDTAEGRSLAVATDMGYVPASVLHAISGCQLVHIESNHDPIMLKNGPYPYSLKKRILGELGHLSNDACAALLPQLVQSGTTRFVLAHLSAHNNTPALAEQTAIKALSSAGITVGRDCLLSVADPVGAQPVMYF